MIIVISYLKTYNCMQKKIDFSIKKATMVDMS